MGGHFTCMTSISVRFCAIKNKTNQTNKRKTPPKICGQLSILWVDSFGWAQLGGSSGLTRLTHTSLVRSRWASSQLSLEELVSALYGTFLQQARVGMVTGPVHSHFCCSLLSKGNHKGRQNSRSEEITPSFGGRRVSPNYGVPVLSLSLKRP